MVTEGMADTPQAGRGRGGGGRGGSWLSLMNVANLENQCRRTELASRKFVLRKRVLFRHDFTLSKKE